MNGLNESGFEAAVLAWLTELSWHAREPNSRIIEPWPGCF